MSLRDRISSWRTGWLPDESPSDDSALEALHRQLRELQGQVERYRHDVLCITADRAEIYKRLIRSRQHVTDLQAQLLAAETALALVYGVVE